MTGRGTGPFVTVMTYNVGNGLAPPDQLVALLRQTDADLVGLQELDADQAAALARDLADVFPYQTLIGSGFSGRGLLSRHPIVAAEWLDLVPDRPDLRTLVEVVGRVLTVIVAHPPPPRLGPRGVTFDLAILAQIEHLASTAVGAVPAVLLGDFNMTERHPSYAAMVALGLVDAYQAAGVGPGHTFPLRLGRIRRINHPFSRVPLPPVVRFDYVWHTRDFTPLAAWVGESAGSDHLPVLARLALPASAPAAAHGISLAGDEAAPEGATTGPIGGQPEAMAPGKADPDLSLPPRRKVEDGPASPG